MKSVLYYERVTLKKLKVFFFIHEIQFKLPEVESRYQVLYIARSVKFSTYIFF